MFKMVTSFSWRIFYFCVVTIHYNIIRYKIQSDPRESEIFKINSTQLLSKFIFIYTKLKLKTCHTRWFSFKNDIGKMTAVFLDAIFKPFFKIVRNTGQQLTIDRTNFLTDGFLQIIHRTGFVRGNTRFQITPKEKTHTLKDRESVGGHGTSLNKRVVHKHAALNRPSLHCY